MPEENVAITKNQQLWKSYRNKLHSFVLNRVNDSAIAEDIVHDVLLKAYSRRDTLKDKNKLQGWLYQITRNTIIDYYRKKKPVENDESDFVKISAFQEEVARLDDTQKLAQCLLPLVQELPEHYRDAIVLSEFDGLTQKDIAAKFNLSLSGAKSRVQRARKLVKELLMECCKLEFDSRGDVMSYEKRDGCGCNDC